MFCPQTALQAGLGRTVSNAVTAVMAVCAMLQLETVPAASAGPVHTAIKVTLALNPVSLHLLFLMITYMIRCNLLNANVGRQVLSCCVDLAFLCLPCRFSLRFSECPAGRFGENCQLKCDCRNNSSCDRATGTCRCGPGYYGHLCEHGEDGPD